MATFKIKCVTERYNSAGTIYYPPDTNTVFVENVNIYTTNDGYVGQTNGNGVFSFNITDQHTLDYGLPVSVERRGYIPSGLTLHSGTNLVWMINDGEIATGNAVREVFSDWPSVLVSASRRAVTENILDNVWYDTAHTATTTYKFCISYTPGNPNNSDKNRFLRVGDIVRRRGTSSAEPDPTPFEPVIPDTPPEIGPNTDPSEYPQLFQYVGINSGVTIIINSNQGGNYLAYGLWHPMSRELQFSANTPSWESTYSYTGNCVSPLNRLLRYDRRYLISGWFQPTGNVASLTLPDSYISVYLGQNKIKQYAVHRVTLVEIPNNWISQFNTPEFNQWIQLQAAIQLHADNYWYVVDSPNQQQNLRDFMDSCGWNGSPSMRYSDVYPDDDHFFWLVTRNLWAGLTNNPYGLSGVTTFDAAKSIIKTSYDACGHKWNEVEKEINIQGKTSFKAYNTMCYTTSGLSTTKKYAYVFVLEAVSEYVYSTENSGAFYMSNYVTNGSTNAMAYALANGTIDFNYYKTKGFLQVKFYNKIN